MSVRFWLGMLFAVAVLGDWQIAFADQSVVLGSGKSVEIVSVGPLISTHGWSSLMLKYRTAIALNDISALRAEADEIWDRFVVDADRGGYQSAIISAEGPEKGLLVKTFDSYNFVFEKRDGFWRTLESKESDQAKLNPDLVRGFVGRLDAAYENKNMNTLQLYMASNWTITINRADEKLSNPQMIDRPSFIAASRDVFAAASNIKHHRDISKISISQDGATADVESREIEEMTMNGHQLADVERSTDSFELKSGVLLWTQSTSVVEKSTDSTIN
jgi:hypothetical protein